jgi:hypothetical protein
MLLAFLIVNLFKIKKIQGKFSRGNWGLEPWVPSRLATTFSVIERKYPTVQIGYDAK